MTKIKLKQENEQPKQNLQELSDEQLQLLQEELQKTAEDLAAKSQTQQFKVTDNIAALKELCKQIKEHVLPQIEFDIRMVTDVVTFNNWIDEVIATGRITIDSVEFKRIIRALSIAKFKGIDCANVLDALSAAVNDVAQEINKADAAYQANAVTLTEIDNEMQRREMQKASQVTTGQAE